MKRALRSLAIVVSALALPLGAGPAGCGGDPGDDDDPSVDGAPGNPDAPEAIAPDAAGPGAPDAARPVDAARPADGPRAADARPGTPDAPAAVDAAAGASPPGAACACDADCQAVGAHAGVCVFGVCMTRPTAACSAAGSTAECGAGSRCWGLSSFADDVCWPDCATYPGCAGECDGDGSCVPASGMDCDATCGSFCTSVWDIGPGPGAGPGPSCPSLPPLLCTAGATACAELITFFPRATPSYDDYPINGETSANQYRSYLRRDLVLAIQYATAKVACKAAGWTSGIGGPLGLGDMSEANGAIPGTSVGDPGHPAGTHTNGFDIDVAYYQTGTSDNHLRPICDHLQGSSDAYHCTSDPYLLDTWRSALLIGTLFEHPNLRVIGVDGRAGPALETAIDRLCADGWIPATACARVALAYETSPDTGLGWYYFHHHHMHVSINPPGAKRGPAWTTWPRKTSVPMAAKVR